MNTIEHIRRLLKDNFLTDAHVEGFWRRPSAAPEDKARFYARVDLPSGHLISCSESRISDEVSVEAPYTSVKVDPYARYVKIRVPYFNGDIRW